MIEAEREQLAMLSRDHAARAGGRTGSALRAAAEMFKGANTPATDRQAEPADGSAVAVVDLDSRWQARTAGTIKPGAAIGDLAAEMARREAAARLAGFDEA